MARESTRGDETATGGGDRIGRLRQLGYDVRVSVVHGPHNRKCLYEVEIVGGDGRVARRTGVNFPEILRQATETALGGEE